MSGPDHHEMMEAHYAAGCARQALNLAAQDCKTRPTPLPWRLSEHDAGVVLSDDPDCDYPFAVAFAEPFVPGNDGVNDGGAANALLIVRSVNDRPMLLSLLRRMASVIEERTERTPAANLVLHDFREMFGEQMTAVPSALPCHAGEVER